MFTKVGHLDWVVLIPQWFLCSGIYGRFFWLHWCWCVWILCKVHTDCVCVWFQNSCRVRLDVLSLPLLPTLALQHALPLGWRVGEGWQILRDYTKCYPSRRAKKLRHRLLLQKRMLVILFLQVPSCHHLNHVTKCSTLGLGSFNFTNAYVLW